MPDIFKILASALKAGSDRADIIAHNLSNISTSGFKKILAAQRSSVVGSPFLETALDLTPGQEVETSDPLYFRMKDQGFFLVEGQGGTRLMRCGKFSVNDQGRLCINGRTVIWKNDAKPVMKGDVPFTVGADGVVSQGGKEAGRLLLVDFSSKQVRSMGGGVFIAEGKGDVLAGTVINAGEASNQDPLAGMIALIENYRQFELCQRALLSEDRILEKSINELGKTQ